MKKRILPVVDLFAGCGGLSLGLEQAGFTPVFVNELNGDAMSTYLRNRIDAYPALGRFQVADIKELVNKAGALEDLKGGLKQQYRVDCNKGELALLVGGPPCQGFSGIGHRRSFSVDRRQLPSNHLYEDMEIVIRHLRPKIFLFENVRGLLFARWTKKGTKGEIWEKVRTTFENIEGYRVTWAEVLAKDYGVPQNRPRVLLVGIREDLGIRLTGEGDAVEQGSLPRPIQGYPHLKELLGDLRDPKYKNGSSTSVYPRAAFAPIQEELRARDNSRQFLKKGAPLTEHEYSRHSDRIIKKFKYMQKHKGKLKPSMQTKKFAQRVLPAEWTPAGPSITATSLADDYVHYDQPRVLTVREWARLQLFPDWYEFSGKRTTGGLRRAGNPRKGIHDREVPKYTQIGNAVPVGLAKAVGLHFKKLLED